MSTQRKIWPVLLFLVIFFPNSCTNKKVSINKKIIIARDESWYLSNLMGKEKNMTAFSDDLLHTIGQMAEIHFQLIGNSRNKLLSGMINKEYDGILSQTMPSPITQNILIFSEPYFLLGPVLIIPTESNITSLDQLNGKQIGVEAGSSLVNTIRQYPNLLITTYNNIFSALSALDDNRIDGVIMDALLANVYVRTFYPTRLKVATMPLNNEGLRLIMLKNTESEEIIKIFNEKLNDMVKDGTYNDLIKKWGLVNTMIPSN